MLVVMIVKMMSAFMMDFYTDGRQPQDLPYQLHEINTHHEFHDVRLVGTATSESSSAVSVNIFILNGLTNGRFVCECDMLIFKK